jgi:hypothetical protein
VGHAVVAGVSGDFSAVALGARRTGLYGDRRKGYTGSRVAGRPAGADPSGSGGSSASWAQRSSQSFVTYKQDFSAPSAVTPYLFVNAGEEAALSFISVDTADGAETSNCLKIITPGNYAGTNSAVFRHPLNSAWSSNTQHFNGQDVWVTCWMKINSAWLIPTTPGLGRKLLNVAQFSLQDGGASGQSNVSAEIVLQDTYQRGFPQAYHQDGTQYPPFEESYGGSDFKLQNGVDNGSGLSDPQRFCLYSTSPTYPGCFKWPINEWFQCKIRYNAATYNGSAGNKFDIWFKRNGQAEVHTHAWQAGSYTLGTPQSGYGGLNGLHWHIYETGRTGGPGAGNDVVYKIDGILVGTQDPGWAADLNPLGILANSMSPGTWAQLTPANSQNAFLGVGAISGSMIHYCNSMPWNPISKRISILGEDHNWGFVNYGSTGDGMRFVEYDAATNAFVLTSKGIALWGAETAHGWDHQAVNPITGDHYYAHQGGGVQNLWARRNTYAAPTTFTETSQTTAAYTQIAIGACWWSGAFTGGSGVGAQGAFMIFNSGDALSGDSTDGRIVAFDPLANSWVFNQTGMSPNYKTGGSTYHSVMEYSAVKNVAVYGGGNDAPQKLWRLNSNGTFLAMPDVPSGKAVGIQSGNLACDPVTGNFLLLSAGQLWELNPSGSGTWTQQTGSRVPPGGVGVPGPSPQDGVISCPIPDYGVVAYITQTTPSGGSFYLYKHA